MKLWRWLILLLPLPVLAASLEAGVDALARQDYSAALKEFRPLAEQGNVVAQVNLGNLYMKGAGVAQDYAEARRWFLQAAAQNEPMAEAKLGILSYYGLGLKKDSTEAASWFGKAAERGDATAQTILASLYAAGEGLPRDNVMAYYWYGRAADAGNAEAATGLATLEEEIAPGDRDEALRLLAGARKAAVERDQRALEKLAETGQDAATGLGHTARAAPRHRRTRAAKRRRKH